MTTTELVETGLVKVMTDLAKVVDFVRQNWRSLTPQERGMMLLLHMENIIHQIEHVG